MKQVESKLEVPSDSRFLHAVIAAAESMAKVQSLGNKESFRLVLASDELFSYLSQVASKDEPMLIRLVGKGFLVRPEMCFKADQLNLSALNFNSVANLEFDDGKPQELGLLLASRMTERCQLCMNDDNSFTLSAEVDKSYPEPVLSPHPLIAGAGVASVFPPEPDLLRHTVGLALTNYPAWNLPGSFASPDRYVDMCQAGIFQNILAVDEASRPAGLLCWHSMGGKAIQFSGPFVFSRTGGSQTASFLVNRFLERVGRDGALCVFSERATEQMPEGYFEPLGMLAYETEGGQARQQVLFRHLGEDNGGTVWSTSDFDPFLHEQYERLALSREVLPAERTNRIANASLLSTSLNRNKKLAQLRPLLDGMDLEANLESHVQILREKGFPNIFFNLDLAYSWQAALYPALIAAGFVPQLLLPCGGRSDIAVFQHELPS